VKQNKYIVVFALLNALTLCFTNDSAKAGQGKGATTHRGGQAGSHMSAKGLTNTNAQWSADPDHGWVRADERHELREQKQGAAKSKQNRGKQKGKNRKTANQ
jgi:hypothetical protein